MRKQPNTRYLLLIFLGLTFGCGENVNISESQMDKTVVWLEEAQSQVNAKQFEEAEKTILLLEKEGALSGASMITFDCLKAETLLGLGKLEEAEATITELERGADNPATVFLLKGRLALARGDTPTANRMFSDAKKADPQVTIPKQ